MKTKKGGFKSIKIVLVMSLVVMGLSGCEGKKENESVHLRFYAGAGLRRAVEAVVMAFEQQTGIVVDVDYAGSGMLVTRAQGDPQADLFMPGDVWYVDRLQELTDNLDERVQVSYFVPTIIVAKGNPKQVKSLQDFAREDLKVALGGAKACQIGRLCAKIFANAGMDRNTLQAKESLTVNELGIWVKMKDVDVSMVWDAIAGNIRDSVDVIEIPQAVNEISTVVCARLKSSPHPAEALQFMQFMASTAGQQILKDKGYRTEKPYE